MKLLAVLFACRLAAQALTNGDVIRMSQAGLSEALILRRIETAPAQFDLSAQALVELKRARVGERIIAAMMGAPGSPAPVAATGPLPASSTMEAIREYRWAVPESFGVFWEAGDQLRPISKQTVNVKANTGRAILSNGTLGLAVKNRSAARLQGIAAAARTPSDAVFVLHLSEARVPNIRLVKALVKNGEREVAVLNKVYSTGAAGDHDIPFAIVRLKSELYRVIPKQPLDRGEFAFVDISAANQAALAIYDFGVN